MKPITSSAQDEKRKRDRWRRIAAYAKKHGSAAAVKHYRLSRERIRQIINLSTGYKCKACGFRIAVCLCQRKDGV